ncbi:MAG: hypothetical protein M0Q54_05755 [Pigmentiphaga sp.]|nr:hypothetical protein [Pigmentiphaga sp.]
MENTYLVCFDFNRIREKFNPDDERTYEIAIRFMEECYVLKDKLIELFPNFVIQVSNDSFLIKSLLNGDKLLELFVKELSDKVVGIKDGDNLMRQIYVADINSLEAYTFRRKQLELEYLSHAICKHN